MSGGGDKVGFANIMKKSLYAMLVIIAPIMSGMMIISREIITIVYARGEFGEKSIALTSTALFFYSIGMLAYGTNEILNKCFYAMEDGKTPMVASFFGIGGAVIFAFLFTGILGFGIGGLALSASVSAFLVSIVLIYKMQKRISFIDKPLIIFASKIILSVGIMIIVTYFAKTYVTQYGIFLRVLIPIAVGVCVYLPLLLVLGVKHSLKEEVN